MMSDLSIRYFVTSLGKLGGPHSEASFLDDLKVSLSKQVPKIEIKGLPKIS